MFEKGGASEVSSTLRNMTLEAIKYNDGRLEILNQLLLPAVSEYESITSVEKAWEAIKTMKVLEDFTSHKFFNLIIMYRCPEYSSTCTR